MKLQEKKLARKLRKRGYSIKEICKKTGLAKSSVSLWVRDIELTIKQKQRLSERGIRKEVIEKQRATRLQRENARRQIIIDKAKKNIGYLLKRDLFLMGIILYWAEGSKTQRGVVKFSNSDPKIIKLMMLFFNKICRVSKRKFRGYIHIHPHLNVRKAENYWSSISGIPLNQFYKTYLKVNRASKNKKNSLPFGTFDINICDTKLFLKIQGWREGICKAFKI